MNINIPHFDLEPLIMETLGVFRLNVDSDEIRHELSLHPDCPSLQCFSDVIDKYGVISGSYKVDFQQLERLPLPYILNTAIKDNEYLLVERIEGPILKIAGRGKSEISIDTLQNFFTGIVVLLAKNPQIKDPTTSRHFILRTDTWKKLLPVNSVAITIALIIVLICLVEYTSDGLGVVIASLKLSGLLLTVILLLDKYVDKNSGVKAFCTFVNSDCVAVLKSKDAMLFGIVSWTDVGIFYFCSTLLINIFASTPREWYVLILLCNLCSLPFTFLSIIVQAKNKSWCFICCLIQTIIWTESIVVILALQKFTSTSFNIHIQSLLVPILAPAALLLFLRRDYSTHLYTREVESKLRKMKINRPLFNFLLANQPNHNLPDGSHSIMIGGATAGTIITLITNPFCGHCSSAHKELLELLSNNSSVQGQILFYIPMLDSKQGKTSLQIYSACINADPEVSQTILSDWFVGKNRDLYKLNSVRNADYITQEDYKIIHKHNKWFENEGFTKVPSILINGFEIPEHYSLSELRYLL